MNYNVPTLGEVADKLTFSFGKIPSTKIQNKHSIKHLNRNLAKRVLYDAFYFFNYFLKKFVYSKMSYIFVNEIKKLIKMKKVFMSVSFGKFKRTRFTEIAEAIAFVRKNKLSNTRLKLNKVSSVEEWDNF